jgi:predicted metal-binding membrane protein
MVAMTGDGVGVPAWATGTLDWSLMTVAMMVPLVLGPIRVVAARSLWRRRQRAIVGFLAGYLSRWLAAGLAISVVLAALDSERWLGLPAVAAAGFAAALVWQLTPSKRRALRSCHRTLPLAPQGWRADRDCFRYGWAISGYCIVSCWVLMLACLLAGHGAAAMVGAFVAGVAERFAFRPDQRVTLGVLAGLSGSYAAAALL